MKRLVPHSLLIAALSAVVACVPAPDAPKELTALQIRTGEPSIALGRTVRPSVTALYSDGTSALVTASCDWTSESSELIGLEAAPALPGTFRARTVGRTVLTARFEGLEAKTELEVTAHALDALRIERDLEGAVPKGSRLQLRAAGLYSDGLVEDLTSDVTWTVSGSAAFDEAIPGRLVGQEAGLAQISAVTQTFLAKATVEITGAALVRIELSPPALSLAHGTDAAVTATAIFTDGAKADVTSEAVWTSADEKVLQLEGGLARALTPGHTALEASFGGKVAQMPATVTLAELISISLSPPMISLPRGVHTRFTAIGHFSDGTAQNLSSQAVWSSSQPAIAAVVPAELQGDVAGLSVGTAQIQAVVNGRTAVAEVTVTQAQLMTLALSNAALVAKGNSLELEATAGYSDSTANDVSAQVSWTSSHPNIASVDANGVLHGHAVGAAVITASYEGLTPQLTVNVTAPALNSIELQGALAGMPKGASTTLTAVGHFSDGHSEDISASAVWGSSNPYVATASNAPSSRGQVTALAQGSADISASMNGVTITVPVLVTAAVVAHLELAPGFATVPVGLTQQLTAAEVYSDGTRVSILSFASWSSSSPLVAVVGAKGLVQATGTGTAVITVEYANRSTSIFVHVTPPVLLGVTLSQERIMLPRGVQALLSATANYSDGSSMDVTAQAVWASSEETVATVSANGLVTPGSNGITNITAAWNGELAHTSVQVTAPEIISVELEPSGAALVVGDAIWLVARATYTDGSTADVSEEAVWVSLDASVASISAQPQGRLLTANAPGAAEVRAYLNGFVASGFVTVQ